MCTYGMYIVKHVYSGHPIIRPPSLLNPLEEAVFVPTLQLNLEDVFSAADVSKIRSLSDNESDNQSVRIPLDVSILVNHRLIIVKLLGIQVILHELVTCHAGLFIQAGLVTCLYSIA